ncbi:RidA family protein [Arthrobacter ginkgonis]|uniref:RidA family protein n=1 Tax=Arthrobacter ginkgonis TaxID=1630594 RepID=A0ABP7BUU8_9MICC
MSNTLTTARAITSPTAPAAIGPYSQAVAAGNLVFVSGQLPIDPATGAFVPGGAAEQAERSIANIKTVLEAAGLGLTDVVKTTVLLADLADFEAVNAVYARHFGSGIPPARSTFQAAGLPKEALVEIEAIAATA